MQANQQLTFSITPKAIMPSDIVFTSVAFRNFKAFAEFSVRLQRKNILVGPNNAGKSTVISAFRALSAAIRSARVRSPDFVTGPGGDPVIGYRIPEDSLPMSTENVHTDLADTETSVTFRISNGNRLKLFFPSDGGCLLIPEVDARTPRTAAAFKAAFPVSVGIVPQLGPVERDERVLEPRTVQRDLASHRASRQFRNHWFHNPDGFDRFAEYVRKTWPGMDILPPEQARDFSGNLLMFCLENRMSRELFWSGSGFQVWCQLLTHIQRAASETILVVDEPEIYLHPDVQRQLLGILEAAGPDLLLATHSTEIIGEADPSDVTVIDKHKKKAVRLSSVEGLQEVLKVLGSSQNITLSRLARNRRLLFVEGMNDFRVLRRFARLLGYSDLAAGADLTPVESGGFSTHEHIRGLAWGFEKVLDTRLRIAAVFDRDFWPDEELATIRSQLEAVLDLAHIHERKEMENYLLIPSVLERAYNKALQERARRSTTELSAVEPIADIMTRVSEPFKSACQAQYMAKEMQFLEKRYRSLEKGRDFDRATVTQGIIERFEARWADLSERMKIVHGKKVLAAIRTAVKDAYGINLTDVQIIDSFETDEIPADIIDFLTKLEAFRQLPDI